MIREERDPAFWNALVDDPETRARSGPAGASADLGPLVQHPAVIPLAGPHGGFIFAPFDTQRYELHTLIGPEGRGKCVLPLFADAARVLFTTTDALEIVTKTAATNRAASIMARRAGFRVLFERQGAAWDGSDMTFYALSLDEWMMRDASLETEGHAFHAMLEAAKIASESVLPVHPEDPAHERAVGACALMVKAGRAAKAVWLYSRWAVLAGYATIELVEEDPPVIDVRDALVTIKDGQLEVLECR